MGKEGRIVIRYKVKIHFQPFASQISEFHVHQRGSDEEESMMQYMKLSMELEMFGVAYFPVLNIKSTEALLGVDALGINIYAVDDKFSPKVSFPWSEIGNVSYTKSMFVVSGYSLLLQYPK